MANVNLSSYTQQHKIQLPVHMQTLIIFHEQQ